jgi:hypothetical protein
MPDGRLIAVSMERRKLLIESSGELVEHADLSNIATWHCNDMVVEAQGNTYVGNFGFDYEADARFIEAELALVRPNGPRALIRGGSTRAVELDDKPDPPVDRDVMRYERRNDHVATSRNHPRVRIARVERETKFA